MPRLAAAGHLKNRAGQPSRTIQVCAMPRAREHVLDLDCIHAFVHTAQTKQIPICSQAHSWPASIAVDVGWALLPLDWYPEPNALIVHAVNTVSAWRNKLCPMRWASTAGREAMLCVALLWTLLASETT